jgi:hypothetical protein
VDVSLSFLGKSISVSTDRKTFKPLEGKVDGDWVSTSAQIAAPASHSVYLRVE